MNTTSGEMRTCPYCNGEILPKALQCRHCRRWMPEISTDRAEEIPAREPTPPPRVSNGQLPFHFAALSILTLGLYEVYWFWRNWRDLRRDLALELQPTWRAIGLLLPVVNVVLVYDQLRVIREACDARGIVPGYQPGLVAATFFAIAVAGNLTLFWPLSLLNVVPLLQVQVALNRLWEQEQPGATVRMHFAREEIVAMIAGLVMTAAAVFETFGSAALK